MQSARLRRLVLGGLLIVGLVLAGCGPEASRVRHGGPGADIGNHGTPIELHGGLNPLYRVPTVGKGANQ